MPDFATVAVPMSDLTKKRNSVLSGVRNVRRLSHI